ncbi:hypothetical protein [Aeromicrobium sp.]|uniref:hypothetical protein n=1 Tax=Aeromicrobium sp. TaxID=1871063 RepID=UPI003D6A0A9C
MLNVWRPGSLFVILFVGSAVPLGELVGSFADSDAQFVTLLSDTGNRIGYVAGSVLLLLAGLAFVWFAHALSFDTGAFRAPLLVTGAAAAIGMIVAALAFATVPLSLLVGSFFGDPGLESGQAVLPQFGYVALGLGGTLPAAIFIAIAARTPDLLPRWLSISSYPVAVLVALTAFLFLPFVLFVLWVVAATVAVSRRGRP